MKKKNKKLSLTIGDEQLFRNGSSTPQTSYVWLIMVLTILLHRERLLFPARTLLFSLLYKICCLIQHTCDCKQRSDQIVWRWNQLWSEQSCLNTCSPSEGSNSSKSLFGFSIFYFFISQLWQWVLSSRQRHPPNPPKGDNWTFDKI